jgi:hypothetical protein
MISRPSEAKKKPFLAADLGPIPRIMSGTSINEYNLNRSDIGIDNWFNDIHNFCDGKYPFDHIS